MPTISTLRLVRRASRRMIRDLPRDLEELGLDDVMVLIGRVREVLPAYQRWDAGKRPAERRAWFGIPAMPPSSRLYNDRGERSFHFAIDQRRDRSASGYDTYAVDGAEVGVEQAADIMREENGPAAAAFDAYTLDHGDVQADDGAVLTTLDSSPERRARQWDQVEAHERGARQNPEGGPPRINVRFERAPDLLLAAAQRNDCPPGLRDLILTERDRVASGGVLPPKKAKSGVAWIDRDAPAGFAWLKALPGWRASCEDAPASLSLGRGTSIVERGELELPRQFDAQACRSVMVGLDAYIQAQVTPRDRRFGGQEGNAAFVPTTLALHRPGVLNHEHNLHLHFQHGTRAVTISEDDELVFADVKVAAIGRHGWTKKLRCEAARLINIELGRLGVEERLNPERHDEMGIEGPTQSKLHGGRTVLERAGSPTDAGLANAEIAWGRLWQAAQQRHDDACAELDLRHRAAGTRIGKREDEAERTALVAASLTARKHGERAHRLQLEAEQIELLIGMARSRATETRRFAPGYADKARRGGADTYDTACWRTREKEAEHYLETLDVELTVEREALAERQRDRASAMAAAEALWSSVEIGLARNPVRETGRLAAAVDPRIDAAAASISPARAATLIATTPLRVSKLGEHLLVLPQDDPDGLVSGVDLASQTKRLTGILAAQDRELSQLRALVRKKGKRALSDEALVDADDWVRQSAVKWRDNVSFRRLVMADEARTRAYDRLVEPDDEPIFWSTVGSVARSMPESLPNLPPGIGDIASPELARRGLTIAVRRGRGVVSPSPRTFSPQPIKRAVSPGKMQSPSKPGLTELEQELLIAHRRRAAKHRECVHREIMTALEARSGGEHRFTGHGARLLRRLSLGEVDYGNAPIDRMTLAQRDAREIAVLERNPGFAALAAKARAGDPALARDIAEVLAERPVDLLARVPVVHGRVDFGQVWDPASGGDAGRYRDPRFLIEETLASLKDAPVVLSEQEGLVGMYDPDLVERSSSNYFGLLYPDVQLRLRAEWLTQREAEWTSLRAIRDGSVSLRTEITPPRSGEVMLCRVEIEGEAPDVLTARRRHRPDWYLKCRCAELGLGSIPSAIHPDPRVAVLIRAKEDQAPSDLLELLAEPLRGRPAERGVADLSRDHAALLAALLAPPPSAPPVPARRRRRGVIPLSPAQQPGGRD